MSFPSFIATSSYDKLTADYLASYNANTYTSNGLGYSATSINSLDKIPCDGTTPNMFVAGADTDCSSKPNCNGVLPAGESMR